MATINTRNVHRSNMLMGFPYGRDFIYDEMVLTGPGEKGEANAKRVIAANKEMAGPGGPKPGEGPSKEERETGSTICCLSGSRPTDARFASPCAAIAIPVMDRPRK